MSRSPNFEAPASQPETTPSFPNTRWANWIAARRVAGVPLKKKSQIDESSQHWVFGSCFQSKNQGVEWHETTPKIIWADQPSKLVKKNLYVSIGGNFNTICFFLMFQTTFPQQNMFQHHSKEFQTVFLRFTFHRLEARSHCGVVGNHIWPMSPKNDLQQTKTYKNNVSLNYITTSEFLKHNYFSLNKTRVFETNTLKP